MPEREKIKTPEEKQFEEFAVKYLEVLKDKKVDDIYKLFLRQKDILLVLGNLKPMTDIELQRGILNEWIKRGYWRKESQKGLKRVLKEKFDIFATSNEKRPDDLIKFYIYDPKQIKEKIGKNSRLLEWDSENNIEQWIEDNIKAGINRDLIAGTLYGFPKSAIEFYVKHKGLGHVSHQTIGTFGEHYGIEKGSLPDDVKLREKQKQDFFQRLSQDKAIQNEYKKLDPLKNKLVEIKNKEILKRTKYKVDTRKEYE